MSTQQILSQYRFPEVKALNKDKCIVIIPIGALEAHGEHLPINTDINIALEFAKLCAQRGKDLGLNIVVADPIPFSYSPFPREKYPGTISISLETFYILVYEILKSLVDSGFKKIVVFNCHGMNHPLPTSAYKIVAETGVSPVLVDIHSFVGEELSKIRKSKPGGIGHGGEYETNLELVFQPDLVDMNKARRGEMDIPCKYFSADLLVPSLVHTWVAKGSYPIPDPMRPCHGDPTVSTVEEGRKWVQIITEKLLDLLKEVDTWLCKRGPDRERPGVFPIGTDKMP